MIQPNITSLKDNECGCTPLIITIQAISHNNEQDAVPAIIHEKNVAASDIHILRNQPKVLAYATPALRIK